MEYIRTIRDAYDNPALAPGKFCYKGVEGIFSSSLNDIATKIFGKIKIARTEEGWEKIRCKKHLKSKVFRITLQVATAIPAILLTKELAVIAGLQAFAPAALPLGQLVFSEVKSALILAILEQVCGFAHEAWNEYNSDFEYTSIE